MVEIISGMRAGLGLGSREVLGQGDAGAAALARKDQGVFVNVANGQLVVQAQDEYLVARGADAAMLRTYNSSGSLNDDNGDGWLAGLQMLRLAGTLNAAGSTLTKHEADGAAAVYSWDSARAAYVSTEGAGAHDTITHVGADNQFEWRDGASGTTQRFEGAGAMRLLRTSDPSGNALSYAYGSNGFLSSVTTASGDATVYTYSGNKLTQLSTVAGGVTSTRVRYTYDAQNRLATVTVDLTPADNAITDGNVYRTTYTYDGASRRIATIVPTDGTRQAFTYVDVGGGDFRVATVTNGLNQTSRFTYGAGFATVADAQGLVTRYDFDAAGQLTRITAPAVNGASPTQRFTYSANGDVTTITDGAGRTVTFQYDARGNQVLQRDHAGNTVARTFDARNQLLTETVYLQPDPDGAGAAQPTTPLTTRHVYDAGGRMQLRFTAQGDGRVTEHRYNGLGERTASITYAAARYPVAGLAVAAALSESTLVAWAGAQDLAATQRVDFAYDGRGQLQSRTTYARVAATGEGIADGTQSVQRHVYDPSGLLLQTIDAAGGITRYTYDGLGRVLSATDAAGQLTLTRYDDAGRKTAITLATGLVTTSSYDAGGRLVSLVQSDTAAALLGESKYFHDASGRLRMTQDPTGVRAWTLYDAAGRKSADIDGNGTMTEYTYDGSGLLTLRVTYAAAVDTTRLVDGAGLPMVSVTAATVRPASSVGDQREWRAYDGAGRLVRTARSYGSGTDVAVTENRYDGASRLVQVVAYANPLTAASVSPGVIGVPAASAADIVTRHFHNDAGQLAGTLDGEGFLTALNYNAAGQLTETIRYASASAAALRAAGTLAQLVPAAADGDIRSVNFHDAQARLMGTVDGEGYLTEYVHDSRGNLTQTVRYATRVAGTVATTGSLAALRPAATPGDRGTTRNYDALGRLASETSPEGVVTQYTYDAGGNIASTVRAAGTAEVRTLLARHDLQGRLTGELSAQGASLLTGGQTQAQVDAIWAQHGTTHAYDAASRRTSTTDALGHRTLFFYDADGALTHSVNALGEVRESRHDHRGRLLEEYAYAGRIATAGLVGGLAPAGLATAIAAIAGSGDLRARYTYTSDARIATEADGQGNTTTHRYDTFGRQIATDQAVGAGLVLSQTFNHDRRGLRTGAVVAGTATTTEYDAFGRATRSVDANGNVRLRTYDRLGRVLVTQDPANALRSASYDAFDRVLAETDPLGGVTRYAYDRSARTITVTTPEGIATTTTHTRHGQVHSVTDGKGETTSYTYDRNGQLLRTSTPLTTENNSYDAAGRLIRTVDAAGTRVDYSYDAANRVLTRRLDPAGMNLTTSYQYDGRGQQVRVTDANGVITTRQFDTKGQVLRETVDPAGLNLQTTYTYDPRGQVLSVTSPAGTVTEHSYDVLGRRTHERIDPTGLDLTRSWTYDRNGNAVSSTDALGNITRYAYDADDRLIFTVDPLGNVRHTTYDAAGRVVRTVHYATPVAIAALAATPTAADIQARVVSQPAFDRIEHRVHDRDGRLTAAVDGTGAVTRFVYDARGNVTSRTSYAARIDLAAWTPGTDPVVTADAGRDASVRTVYDALDRAIYTVDGIGAVVAQSYDGAGRVLQRTAYATAIPANTGSTQAAVTAAVAAVANPARDALVRNVYDAAGRLTWSVDGTGAVIRRSYDKSGNLVREHAHATPIAAGAAPSSALTSAADRATAMAYDAANRLVLQVDALRGVTEHVYDAAGQRVRSTQYANPIATVPALGATGTAAAIRALVTVNPEADRTSRWAYDAAGRQVLAVDALGAVSATEYDANGNATAVTAHATPAGRAVAGLAAVPTLAAMKALVSDQPPIDRTHKNAYDAAGRLVYRVDAMGAVTAMQYDGIGQLTRTTRHAKTIAIATGTSSAAGIANNAASIAAAIAPVANAGTDQTETFSYNAAGQRITFTDALGFTESYGNDALGQRLSFVNKRGFTWTYTYDAAGRMLSDTSPAISVVKVSVNAAGKLVDSGWTSAVAITRNAYDALGNLTQRTEAAGRPEERTTRYEYDSLGRQIRVIYPPVGVYDPAADSALTNGDTGVALRTETTQSLDTLTVYDAFGNAVANRDLDGGLSQKVHDVLGRVVYEVDAMGFVTSHARNAFGEVVSLTRHAVATGLAARTVARAGDAVTRAQLEAVINAASFNRSADRALRSSYDRAGRVLETIEPGGYVYDTSAVVAAQVGGQGKTTQNTYNAFGDIVQTRVLRNAATGTWATTTHYFDLAGRNTATIDAMGYLTRRTYDSAGNLIEELQHANAVPSGWTLSGFPLPPAPADDRRTNYAYDRLNRKISETRRSVEASTTANGTSALTDLVTRYAYDALGNQTAVTDANGGVTRTYYDALGRVRAIAAPTRNAADGTALTPLTEFRRDALGNLLVQIDWAKGTSSAGTSFNTPVADGANDRRTVHAYDIMGRAIGSTDANGASDYSSYYAHGKVAKHWQGVTGNDGATRTAYELSVYDKLGRLVESATPASTRTFSAAGGIVDVRQSQAGHVSTRLEYNAFGELTRKGVQGERQEYFDYDNAGRLWRTNADDGVDRIYLYDTQGHQTAEIRSAGSGRDNHDIKGFVNAEAANANPYTRRVDIQYDLLGRVTTKTEAARRELQGGVSVGRQYTTATIELSASSQKDENSLPLAGALNRLRLNWNNLSHLGSGDLKVSVEYRTPLLVVGGDESSAPTYLGGTLRSHTSGIINGDAHASGYTLDWVESAATTDFGVGRITRLVVHKKDINGEWRVVIDQPPGHGGTDITVAAPPNAAAAVTLQLRAAGSTGNTGWWTASLADFGNAYRFDARGLAAGSYEYRVTLTAPGEAARVTATGTLAIAQQPIGAIDANIHFNQPGLPSGLMVWDDPGPTTTQALRYRANGVGAWSTLTVSARPIGPGMPSLTGVDTRSLPAGNYQYELLWTPDGAGFATSRATGVFTIKAGVPARWVSPVNLPPITGLSIGSTHVGGTVIGNDEGSQPIYSGGTRVPALQWTAAGADVARFRRAGEDWRPLVIDNSGQGWDESLPHGVQRIALHVLGPGSYEIQILVGNPPTAQATAVLTIHSQGAGHYRTVHVSVPVHTPLIAYYQPVHETRYGTRSVPVRVWVSTGPPVTDESGMPIHYPGRYETRYTTETYAYQVQVGQTPVYATDEGGQLLYQTSYVQQSRQVWVEGTTPSPTVQVTTPPYTAGYTARAIATAYSVSTTTAASSVPLSATELATASQAAGINGDDRWLRPTVKQSLDRWGNVIERSDPRSLSWTTSYKYNANNQLILQTLPNADGGTGAGSPTTAIYYDKLGRQIAVKDANGNIEGQSFDAGGNLVSEQHADGGVVTHAYNAFGDRVRTTDALGRNVTFAYDKLGQLLRMVNEVADVYGPTNMGAKWFTTRNQTSLYTYDQLGRKLTQTNGAGETIAYAYDLRGNLIDTRQPLGQVVRSAYDVQGRKIAQTDANGHSATWRYDYFGLLLSHNDIGGAHYTYTYDHARQLVALTNTRGQWLVYTYDAAGQITTIHDRANDKLTTYAWDLAGRKLRERVVQQGHTYQDNHLAYDARGNLRDVADARVHLTMAYDLVGNRTEVNTTVDYQGTGGESRSSTNRFFKYDAMNRQVIVDAVDAAGNLGQQGHAITYDKAGNRTSDTYWGNKVTGQSAITGYDETGTAIYSATDTTYVRATGYTREDYRYDNLNRLQSVVKDGTQIDRRFYDGAGRVVQSGPGGSLPASYAALINAGLAPEEMNGHETRVNRYDANGRLLSQEVVSSDEKQHKLSISWDPKQTRTSKSGGSFTADGYDAAGNVLGYVVANHVGGVINEYSTTLQRFEGYQEGVTQGVSTKNQPGRTTQSYDANGYLVGINDSTQANNNRSFVNDAQGRALYVNQAGHIQRQLIVNGEVLGVYGVGVDAVSPATGRHNNPNFANVVDFDFGYAKVSASYPAPSPGAYTVNTGDTLQSIAQGAYGDSSLWYRIAEANGLFSSADLKVGQTLNIPNRVATISNNASTFKPYDPSAIEGDKTPSLAAPAPKKRSLFGQLLMAVIVIVVAAYTGGGMVGAFMGSMAGQTFAVATGMQDKISWKGVAMSMVSAGVAQGIGQMAGGFLAGQTVEATMVRAALGNAVTQGVGVATGLQNRFDWRGVAASAVGAGVGHGVGAAMGMNDQSFPTRGWGEQFGARLVTGLAAGTAVALARGGRVAVQQVAVDAFGNALGESLASASTEARTAQAQPVDPLGDFVNERLNAQARRDRYSLAGMGAQLGSPSGDLASEWSARIDQGIGYAASQLPDTPAMSSQELAWRKRDVEEQVRMEIAAQEARDASVDGAQMFMTGGPARNVGRGGIGTGGFEMVRNGNWDAALNIGADPFGVLPDFAGLQQDMNKMSRVQAENRINDMRQRMTAAGMTEVPADYRQAWVTGGAIVRDYGATVDDLQRRYEGFVRDKRLQETWGENYQSVRLGKSRMTAQEFEKRVLDLQQQATDKAYAKGVEAIARGAITVKDGEYARTLGNLVDLEVRGQLRLFAKFEGINDSMASTLLGVNRTIRGDPLEGRGIPDNRLGYNLFADTTLARKNGYTEQIMKWNAIRPGSNYLIIRPTDIGGAYVIPRLRIQPFNPMRTGRSL